ncbi:FAD-binding oxidoreductase [Streptomyces oryzae]|uniref:FAD-binding oxidoreductase n=1 Tax=Streptomyces oryzae TaxID=1434886 RepID=A0ABS3XAS3_9ACTN|nr:FAD-binding oxidoreductase [Streptomyces oryzae]MBO8192458.1 FAD-binding oxidoreductase [Streptomyces oryzae]
MANVTADVIIVGAGVIGSATAFELSKLGLRVTVVDKTGGVGFGSTSASSAVIRFTFSTWDSVATAWESKHYWEGWTEYLGHRDESGMASYIRTGVVTLDAPVVPTRRMTDHFDRIGVPYEIWDAETLRTRVPAVDVGAYWPPKSLDDERFFEEATGELGALYTPDGGFVDDPQLAAHNLAAAAQNLGCTFLFRQTVIQVDRNSQKVLGVTLEDGTRLAAPVVVNAAGPWSGALNDLAGVGGDFSVSVRPMRQEVHQVAAPAAYGSQALPGPTIGDLDLGTYMRAAAGRHLLVGGTEPECDPLEWIDDPDQADPRPTSRRFQAQVTRAARRIPGLTVPNTPQGVAGVYDVAEDWTPIYDRTALDGYYVAMGTSGNQFKNAPLAGRFMAALISGGKSGRNHDVEPLGYPCEYTEHVINLGAFSRKRSVNKLSSSTVMG